MRRFAFPLVGLTILLGLLLFSSQASTLEPTTFVDVSSQVGITFSNQVPSSCLLPFSTGSAWADYDNDGDEDLYITNQGGNNALYRNDGDTNSDGLPDFTDVAATAGVTIPDGVSIAAVFIDYDNDNDDDLYVTNWDDDGTGTAFTGNVLFQNQLTETGSATFLNVTAAAGPGLDNGGVGNRSAWGDFDNDGFLDMYLTNHGDPEGCPVDPDNQDHLFHNNGDGTFSDVTEYVCNGSATCAEVEGLGFSPGWVDIDNDSDLDLYLVNDILNGTFHENVLWRNDGPDGSGGWTFTDITAAAGADLAINGMGLGVGDYDNDGWLDFAMSDGGPAELLRNLGDGTFADTAVSSGVNAATSGSVTWGTVFFDHDNDGWLDLYFAAGGLGTPGLPNIFLGNNQDGTFVDLSSSSGLDNGLSGKNVSIVDFDNDGFVDVFVNSYGGTAALYRNEGNSNNWLTVTVEGTTSNADAIGTRLELTANGITQIREINDGPSHGGGDYKMAHFGLDDATGGSLTVHWPNGITENLGTVTSNQRLHLIEPTGGGPVSPTTFTEIATQVGLATTHTLDETVCGDGTPPISNGSAWADYDNDGDQDVYMTNQGTANRLYRNDGDTNSDGLPDFTDVAAVAGVDDATAVGLGAVFIDYDNDGDQDLYITNWDDTTGENRLYQNQLIESGSATFTDVADAAGVNDTGRAITAAWADFDQDSFLDLYITKHSRCLSGDRDPQDRLFHNNGDGTFTDVSGWLCPGGVAPCDQLTGQGFSPGWVDYDNDADLDLFLINDYGGQFPYHNVLWRNDGSDGLGGWTFTDVTTPAGLDTTDIAGMGLGIGDYDNDGWFDFAWSDVGPVWLAHNEGDGTLTDTSGDLGTTGGTTWGTVFFDHENDGWLDVFYVSGAIAGGGIQNLFFGNNQDGTFSNLSVSSGLNDAGRGRSASIVDFDEDGFVDVMVGNYGENYVLYHNDAGNGANWLTVTVEGTVSNRDGIGTRLTLTADGVTQMREITSGPTHGGGDQKAAFFGLGTATSGTLTVRWPNGVVENLGTVSANQQLHLVEPGGGPLNPNVFDEVSGQVGMTLTHSAGTVCNPPIGMGSAWGDYDNDGDQDLFATNRGGANYLYRNDGDTNSDGLPDFTDVAATLGVTDTGLASLGAAFVDYDNDGDQDLYVTNWGNPVGNNILYENQLVETGSVAFADVTGTAGIEGSGRTIMSAWGDFDQDGFLDLYITKHMVCSQDFSNNQDQLFHNNGDGTFTDVTNYLCAGASTCAELEATGFAPGWFDYDNDGDLDLYLVNDRLNGDLHENVMWRNDGAGGPGWIFTDVSAATNTNVGLNGMGLGIGDYNNDGWFDLAFSNLGPGRLLENQSGVYTDISSSSGVTTATTDTTTWGTVFFDHDNDMWLDLFFVNGDIFTAGLSDANIFMHNNGGDGTFTDLSVASGLNDSGRGRSGSIVDFDGDGFMDLLVGNYDDQYLLYHNRGDNGANWLTVTVAGTVSNRDGIGTRLTLTADSVTQMREITSGPTHGGGDDQKAAFFGLGTATSGTLTVRWPNGIVENIGVVSANQTLHLVEPGGGPTPTPTNTPPPTATSTPGPTATPTLIPTATNTPDGSGGTFTFTAVADASVLSNRPDNNYGGSTTIAVDGSPIINSYLRFDVQGLTGSVNTATLRVWADTTNGTGIDAASVADTAWGETSITFNNAPAAGAALGSSGATTAGAWAEVDVTGSVTADGLVSFMISTTDSGRINFNSREGANAPELVVVTSGGPPPTATNTPVPATATNTPVPTETSTAGPSPTSTSTAVPPTPTNTPEPGSGGTIYVSSVTGGTAGSVAFGDEDVLAYDTNNGTWAMQFDASDLGITTNDLDAYYPMADGSILVSFVHAQDLGSLTGVDDSDILRFVPTSLGDTTAGTFEMYFDGSDVDLTTGGEDVDAVGFTPDGRLLISTIGNYSAGGVSGAGNDLLLLDDGVFGENTSGTWALYFDGEDVELTDSTENISGVWVDAANGDIYLAVTGAFTVTGASGDGADIFVCTPGALGDTTTCTYSLFWDGSANGFGGQAIDGLAIVP